MKKKSGKENADNIDKIDPVNSIDNASDKLHNKLKNKLTEMQKHVLLEKGTEPPFTGKYVHTKDKGMYSCAACGNVLFNSETKFDSGTGWPSFTDPVNLEHVELKKDFSHGMIRTEVNCKNCGSHLGHVFNDGPKGKQRYCINSCSLELMKKPTDKKL